MYYYCKKKLDRHTHIKISILPKLLLVVLLQSWSGGQCKSVQGLQVSWHKYCISPLLPVHTVVEGF